MDTTEDMLRLVEVRFFLQNVQYVTFIDTSQKILDNSKHVDSSKQPMLRTTSFMWNYFVENVLGLKSVHVTNQSNLNDIADQKDEGAFELLRV
jgi:hypothetical protein